ncbi:MAG: hypothetical protein P1P84_19955 [Deferrisomatales bacterium]|nr:hypothetical protein [Deferrisomatales bacterium]
MSLKSRIVAVVLVVFVLVFAGAYVLFGWLKHDILTGIGVLYAEKQVLYNRERTLHPLMRELALARKLAQKNQKLEHALAEVRTLSGLLPTCMYCKKIRDHGGWWKPMEVYISQRTTAEFSHGICPDCLERAYADAGQPSPREG